MKGAVTVTVNEAVGYFAGEYIEKTLDYVGNYAGSVVTDVDETAKEFAADVAASQGGDQFLIKEGALFVLESIIGVALPEKARSDGNAKGLGGEGPDTKLNSPNTDARMEPEADFAGNVGDVRDPSIGSIAEHMVEASVKGKQIYGGHNLDNFNTVLSEAGGEIKGSPIEIAPGIYDIKYTLPGKTYKNGSVTKTVYDPAVYPNMDKLADSAAHKALTEYQLTGKVPDTVDVGGIKFKTPVVIRDGVWGLGSGLTFDTAINQNAESLLLVEYYPKNVKSKA